MVQNVATEPPTEGAPSGRPSTELVTLRVQVRDDAAPGRYPMRLITRAGVTNALPIQIVDLPVAAEPDGSHDARESAIAASKAPAVYAGRLSRRGESDLYSFAAEAGQTLTFEVISGLPQIAAAGSAATVPNFDPALSLFEPAGSWFDPRRLNRIAHNDEPVWVFGRPTDAHLVHRLQRRGLSSAHRSLRRTGRTRLQLSIANPLRRRKQPGAAESDWAGTSAVERAGSTPTV